MTKSFPSMLALCLTAVAVAACGNQTDSSGSAGAEAARGATEAVAQTPAPPATPPPLKARILGEWTMSTEDFIQTAPADKRSNLLVLHYSFRDADPTEAELEAAGIKGVATIGIGLMRQKRIDEPDDPSVIKGRQAYVQISKMAPGLEVTATELVILAGGKRRPSSYTIMEESEDRLVVRSVDGEDPTDIDLLTVTAPDEHSLRIVDDANEGEQEQILNFRRKGAPAPTPTTAAVEPDLRSDPRAAKLIGRWNAGSHSGAVTFAADGAYTLNGAGGDVPGRFTVTSINGTELMLRTTIDALPLASDRIRIVFSDDTHLTWTNLGTSSTSQYTKQ